MFFDRADKVFEQALTLRRQDGLGVELNPEDGELSMPDAHDLTRT